MFLEKRPARRSELVGPLRFYFLQGTQGPPPVKQEEGGGEQVPAKTVSRTSFVTSAAFAAIAVASSAWSFVLCPTRFVEATCVAPVVGSIRGCCACFCCGCVSVCASAAAAVRSAGCSAACGSRVRCCCVCPAMVVEATGVAPDIGDASGACGSASLGAAVAFAAAASAVFFVFFCCARRGVVGVVSFGCSSCAARSEDTSSSESTSTAIRAAIVDAGPASSVGETVCPFGTARVTQRSSSSTRSLPSGSSSAKRASSKSRRGILF